MGAMNEVTDANFQGEVLSSDIPVLVDFTATWCGPCKAMAPILEQVAQEYEGRLKVVSADINEARESAMAFMVRSVPTLLVFKNGAVAVQNVGPANRNKIDKMIEGVI